MLGRGGSRVAMQPQAAAAVAGGGGEKCGEMKYHSLSRRELQALCKEYHIPANKSNVAMAQALAALHNTTAVPTLGAKLLTSGRPTTVTIPPEEARLKPVEKKPSSSSRIVGLATRSDREGDAKKLLAKSSNKKLIADPTSCQAAATRQMVTRKPQALKLRPKNVNGSERVSKETHIELLPSISPMEKSKMGRSMPVLKKRETYCKETMTEKSDRAVYKPSGKENHAARDGKTRLKKSSQQKEEVAPHAVQNSLQPAEMKRNGTIMSFNNIVKSVPRKSVADGKLLSSACDSGAVKAQDDGEQASIVVIQEGAVLEEENFPVMVERHIGNRSFCVYESCPEVELKKPCNNKKVTVSVPPKATELLEPKVKEARVAPTIAQTIAEEAKVAPSIGQTAAGEARVASTIANTTAEAPAQSLCLEELGREEAAAQCKESDAEFVSEPLSPKKIESTKSEKSSSSLSTPNSVIDYILLPPWSPPKTSAAEQQQPLCHGRSKRLTATKKTGAANSRENASVVGERSLRKNDYLIRSLHKLRTSIRDKVIRKEKS
ncbi:hypothetical protein CY35_06G121200 [Sphagnum magellanicum]|nr:hypothetical protein CY35_06G121200 [Sphagnum magellanicum]